MSSEVAEQEVTIAMHAEFPAWLGEFELGANEDARQLRWIGVAAVVDDADKHDIEALVRIAFKTRHKPASTIAHQILGKLREADPEHPVEDNSRELQVLAGACLIAILEGDDLDSAAVVALAICTASLNGARTLNLPMDLVGRAQHQLQVLADFNGKRPDLSEYLSAQPVSLTFDAAAAKYQQQPDPTGMAATLKMVADSTQAAIRAVMRNQQAALKATATLIAQQDEELQMLWWLTGGRSWDFDCVFGDVDADAQPLVFAKELADQTTLLPGPVSIKSLLSRAGVRAKKSTPLAKIIGAATTSWLEALVQDQDPSPVTLPIHLAIKRQIEAGPGEAWVPGWAGAVEVPADQSYSQLAVAESFYRERLLLSAMK